MSANGAVTGYAHPASISDPQAFLYRNGTATVIGTLGGSRSYGDAVNNKGQVVGQSAVTNDTAHAFLYQDGKMRDLGTLGGSISRARGINNRGVVVGESFVRDDPGAVVHAFVFRDGKMHDLGTLPGGTYSSARVINDEGMIAGVADVPGGNGTHAFIYAGGVMRDIGSFGGSMYVAGINNRGQVVGTAGAADRSQRGVLYSEGRLENLNNLLVPGCGWWVQQAYAINDAGQIVADVRKGGLSRIALLDPSGRGGQGGQGNGAPTEPEAEGCF